MQQDPGGSPATADTPGEFSLFSSPKRDVDYDLSPQYIPAEKYELERKAMYDNLLRPNSPRKEETERAEESVNQPEEVEVTIEEEMPPEIASNNNYNGSIYFSHKGGPYLGVGLIFAEPSPKSIPYN